MYYISIAFFFVNIFASFVSCIFSFPNQRKLIVPSTFVCVVPLTTPACDNLIPDLIRVYAHYSAVPVYIFRIGNISPSN